MCEFVSVMSSSFWSIVRSMVLQAEVACGSLD